MEFEPFQSDEDDALTFMPEKKKKDKDEKRRKSKGSYKSDKRDRSNFNDGSTPTAMTKTKTVHGVVGPAEYITETSPTQSEANDIYSNQVSSPTAAVSAQIFNQQQTPTVTNQPVQQQATQWTSAQAPQLHQTPQKQQHQHQEPKNNFNSTPNFQQFSNTSPTPYSSNFNSSTKIERPHSSVALLQERASPQSPTPFKQPPTVNPQKMTLLVQALSANPGQSPQQQQPNQTQVAANLTHHRNQSYSRAMSLPMSTASKQDIPESHSFRTTFDNGLEVETKLAASPIIENPLSPFQSGGSFSSPPLTPNNNISSSSQELWSNAPIHPHQSHHIHKEVSPNMQNKMEGQKQEEVDWAHFSHQADNTSRSGSLSETDHVEIPRRRSQAESMASSSMASSVPESTSSIESESENEDSVWGITTEQREYYTNHFKKLQPMDGEVIKGPQARDFFVKSTLPNETLSRIWNLSDRDKDGALNLDEFCIAMHLVVAVVHGMDLPSSLPASLIDRDEVTQVTVDDVDLGDEDVSQLISDDKPDSEEWAAEFDSPDGVPIERNERIQTFAQPSPTTVTVPSEPRVHPVSNPSIDHLPPKDYPTDDNAPSSPQAISSQKDVSGKITAIARPRASANKNVNLMDASPWQLLPPPSGKVAKQQGTSVKKSLKMDSYDSGLENAGTTGASPSNKLVNIEHMESKSTDDVANGTNGTLESDCLKVKKKDYCKNLSKEKSRSIDSLRSDISESSMFEWKRQSIRRESRPRSLTGESLQNNDGAQFEPPPIPPPRRKGHARASSLDFNQVFTTKSSRIGSEPKLQTNATTPDGTKTRPQKPPRSNPPSATSVRARPLSKSEEYKRSVSHETTLQKPREIDEKSLSKTLVQSAASVIDDGKKTNSKEHIVRFMDEPEVLANDIKSPMEIRMRKHELQARLRDLKTKNSTLSSLISQLGMEWKEVYEERISLEIRLQRAKQELE